MRQRSSLTTVPTTSTWPSVRQGVCGKNWAVFSSTSLLLLVLLRFGVLQAALGRIRRDSGFRCLTTLTGWQQVFPVRSAPGARQNGRICEQLSRRIGHSWCVRNAQHAMLNVLARSTSKHAAIVVAPLSKKRPTGELMKDIGVCSRGCIGP